ncbi:MAG: hypothetical protein KIS90_00460 [Phenylobacterium sp.]|nr:hypothetical protein [Phenylobacterium sp.]
MWKNGTRTLSCTNRISRLHYDAAGRVTHVEAGVGSGLQQVTERRGWSPGGQRTSLTDANGNPRPSSTTASGG